MRQFDSPHHNARPNGVEINLIILHAISLPPDEFDMHSVEAFFMGYLDTSSHPAFSSLTGMNVSAHFVVDRHGMIAQFVPVAQRAWHAGESEWEGKIDCNDYSIGIEMLGDETHPYTDAQYRETARLCRVLMKSCPAINSDRIVGHSDIAPGRKWDPGKQWNWGHFHRSLAHIRRFDLDVHQ